MTSNKYQCLVDALGNSGVTLPPIKEGTEAEELPSVTYAQSPPPNDVARFGYKAADGRDVDIYAEDEQTGASAWWDKPGRRKSFSAVSFSAPTPDNPVGPHELEAMAAADLETGGERSARGVKTIPTSGTISETADKIFNCRTPPMS